MPIDHSAPPEDAPTAEVQMEGPLGDYFNAFMERVIAGAGDTPSEQVRAGMRAFFFCGANAALSILFSRPMQPADRKIIVEAMSQEITGKEFFEAASKSLGTIQ
jgi:hypothetical protein